jgi:hypothetical protein
MQTKRFLKGALAVAAAALLAACEQGPLPLAEPSGPMGTVTIRVTAAGAPVAVRSFEAAASPAVARTVFPAFDAFETFELTFTGERTIVMTVDAAEAVAGVTIKLVEGTYALAVKGKKGGAEIAEGTATAPISIDSAATVEAAVVLSPRAGGTGGVFSYNLTLPADFTAATLTLTDKDGAAFNDSEGVPVGPVNLLTAGTIGVVENLSPGEYRLALSIVRSAGEDIGIVKFANETVYVYSGLESAFERNFSSVQFIIETVWAHLSSQPPNTAANPYPVDLGGLDLTTDLTLVDLFYNLNQAGRYVALDLSGCTMGGMTEFDPGAANTGEKLIVSLVLPDAVTNVKAGNYDNPPFRYFTALTSVTGKATAIGENAFKGCSKLTEASFPLAETLGPRAFYTTGLETISLPAAITISNDAFWGCSALRTVDSTAITIGDAAFSQCTALETVNLSKATNIGGWAFVSCTSLTEVSLPEAITIGGWAFVSCTSLTEVSLPKATTISELAFMYCAALETLFLPKATSFELQVFEDTGTKALTITLGSTAPTLMGLMFNNAGTKTVNVKVPSGATGYGNLPVTFSGGENTTGGPHWGEGFRGKGWIGTEYPYGGGYSVNANIILTIKEE